MKDDDMSGTVKSHPNPEDLRGSTPVLTARDVLIEVREDVRYLRTSVDVLASQNLDSRLSVLEDWRSHHDGQVSSLRNVVLIFGSIIASIVGILTVLTFTSASIVH
jgi:hypothetical protein